MIKLTQKALQYNWGFLDKHCEYDFTDWDEATKDWSGQKSKREKRIELGRPRYEIVFHRIPKGYKREVDVRLTFDDKAEYQGIKTRSKYTKRQMEEWEIDVILWLMQHGYVELLNSEDDEISYISQHMDEKQYDFNEVDEFAASVSSDVFSYNYDYALHDVYSSRIRGKNE